MKDIKLEFNAKALPTYAFSVKKGRKTFEYKLGLSSGSQWKFKPNNG